MKTRLIRSLPFLLILLVATLLLAAGQATTSSGSAAPRLLDDFEDGNLDAAPGLPWIVIADDLMGGASTGQIDVVEPGAAGTKKALRLQAQIREGFRTPFVGAWTAAQAEGSPTDLSSFQGIRFQARGQGGVFRVALRSGQTGGGVMNFVKAFDAPKDWTAFSVPFSELAAQAPSPTPVPWSPQTVSWIGFITSRPTPGDVELQVDQVELY